MPRKYTPKEAIDAFWLRVCLPNLIGLDECWEWQGYKNHKGYGAVRWHGKLDQAHRISYKLCGGSIPQGYYVCHKCDNPSCVNPAHLWVGTPLDNNKDMRDKARYATGAKNGRYTKPERTSRGESKRNHKLNAEQVREIRNLYATGGVTMAEIGIEYKVSESVVWGIIHRRDWKHIL